MPDTSLHDIQLWMQATLLSKGSLREKLETAKAVSGLDILETIKHSRGIPNYERLDIYASGYVLRLLECLKLEYPLLSAFMGQELFDLFAKAYLVTSPSSSWAVHHFGKGFADFLARTKPEGNMAAAKRALMELPAEIARFEHAKSIAANAKGLEGVQASTFDAGLIPLMGCDFNHVFLKTPDSLQLLHLNYAVHQFERGKHLSTYSGFEKKPVYLAIFRVYYQVQVTAIAQWEYELLLACDGTTNVTSAAAIAAEKCPNSVQFILSELLSWIPVAKERGYLG